MASTLLVRTESSASLGTTFSCIKSRPLRHSPWIVNLKLGIKVKKMLRNPFGDFPRRDSVWLPRPLSLSMELVIVYWFRTVKQFSEFISLSPLMNTHLFGSRYPLLSQFCWACIKDTPYMKMDLLPGSVLDGGLIPAKIVSRSQVVEVQSSQKHSSMRKRAAV